MYNISYLPAKIIKTLIKLVFFVLNIKIIKNIYKYSVYMEQSRGYIKRYLR